MTRFARAKGSKASNERVPESATSWQDMKKQLKNVEERNLTQENDLKSEIMFNNSEKQDRNVKWSEFPDLNMKNNKHAVKATNSKHLKKLKHKTTDKQDKNIQPSECSGKQTKLPTNDVGSKNMGELYKNLSQELEHKIKPRKANKKEDKSSKLADTEIVGSSTEIARTSKMFESSMDKQSFKKNNKEFKKIKHLERKRKMKSSNTADVGVNEEKSLNKDVPTEYKRRKPNSEINKIFINGNEIEISYIDGFPVKKADAERLKKLRKDMISKGIPKSEVAKALKLERRKAEKSLSREKKKVCFNCRNSGHILSECPMLNSDPDLQMSETGICFKCGSTEHTHFECRVTRGDNFKFAQCFICKEQGHIARQCPDNDRGLYPKGGSCRICGAVTHLKKDCPKYQSEQEENRIVAHTIDDHNIESLEIESGKTVKGVPQSQKIIKF